MVASIRACGSVQKLKKPSVRTHRPWGCFQIGRLHGVSRLARCACRSLPKLSEPPRRFRTIQIRRPVAAPGCTGRIAHPMISQDRRRDGSRMRFSATRPGMYRNVLIRAENLNEHTLCGTLRRAAAHALVQEHSTGHVPESASVGVSRRRVDFERDTPGAALQNCTIAISARGVTLSHVGRPKGYVGPAGPRIGTVRPETSLFLRSALLRTPTRARGKIRQVCTRKRLRKTANGAGPGHFCPSFLSVKLWLTASPRVMDSE
jgi:hypothetical protein